ncbi:MAG: DUF1049 domain-containing protein [Gammaproteobacteria bacterium]|nr:DUF1049 domain-containing protein [Gammaproteobacteria bacterium]
MRIIYFLFILLILIIGATFAYLNAVPAQFNYYFGTVSLPLSLLLALGLGVGLLLGFIAMLPPILRAKGRGLQLKRKLKSVEQEVENLRTLPIKE